MSKKVCTQFSNKAYGTQFERDFAKILAEHGFWAHRMQDNKNGQPFDIIAAKNGNVYAIDCKDCQSDVFSFERIEENQRSAMSLWEACGNRTTGNEAVFRMRSAFWRRTASGTLQTANSISTGFPIRSAKPPDRRKADRKNQVPEPDSSR